FDFFFQAEDGIRDFHVTGVQTCALPISSISSGKAAVNRSNAAVDAAALAMAEAVAACSAWIQIEIASAMGRPTGAKGWRNRAWPLRRRCPTPPRPKAPAAPLAGCPMPSRPGGAAPRRAAPAPGDIRWA